MKYECPECGEELDKDDVEFDYLFCGETDVGEGFYRCGNCEALFNYEGDLWECDFCNNEEMIIIGEEVEYWHSCGEVLEDPDYCYYCG